MWERELRDIPKLIQGRFLFLRLKELAMDDRLLKSKEVAQRLSISNAYAYRLMSIGSIPCVKLGSRAVRCRPEDLEEFILANLQINGSIGSETSDVDEHQFGRPGGTP
jgi:excisionase family DNA binding protein